MTIAFTFPGQGSQAVGMGKALAEAIPAARAVFDEVDQALGEKLSAIIWDGPDAELTRTRNAQPALMAVGMAVVRALEAEGIGIARRAAYVAGHSLGEYSALAAAGSLSLAETARLLRTRGEAMQEAVPEGEGAMAALLGLDLEPAVEIAAEAAGHEVCEVANDNAPGQVVVSGEVAALRQLIELAPPKTTLELPVSVPFHCSLLKDAAAGFAEVLQEVDMQDPAFPVWCNVDARPVTTAAAARDALRRQFAGSVQWQASIEGMLRDGVRRFVEFGPKAPLVKMVAQIASHLGVAGIATHAATNAGEIEALRTTGMR